MSTGHQANYVQEVLDELAERLADCDTPLLELYALLALTRGTGTTLENVHDAWAVWRNRTRPDHPALIPFIMLAPDVRELDRKYAEAIREAAAELVLGGESPAPEPPGDDTGGRWSCIAFMGRNEYTGYVRDITKNGQPAYRVDLPGLVYGGNPLEYVEYAASAWFSEWPVTEASVRAAWEAKQRAAERRRQQEAEWARMQDQRALTDGSAAVGDEDDYGNGDREAPF